jgi:hypothetical protein
MAVKGSKSRPVLTISRPENEQTYLDHQIRTLRRLHPGAMDTHWDRTPGDGFYDTVTACIKSPLLWPAYELLYPRDRRTITVEALELVGFAGLVALWCDKGTRFKRKAEIEITTPLSRGNALMSWAAGLGHPCRTKYRSGRRSLLTWDEQGAKDLMKALRPGVHPAKRPTLWPGKAGEQKLYACR